MATLVCAISDRGFIEASVIANCAGVTVGMLRAIKFMVLNDKHSLIAERDYRVDKIKHGPYSGKHLFTVKFPTTIPRTAQRQQLRIFYSALATMTLVEEIDIITVMTR